jgi:hypothetical protein
MMDPLTLEPLRAWPPGTVAAIATCIRGAGDDPTEHLRAPAPGAWSSPISRRLAPARAKGT